MTIIVHGSEIEWLKNNRRFFYVYVCLQIAQAIYGLMYTIYIMTQISYDSFGLDKLMLFLSLFGELFFTIMLSSLISFHTYLMVNNLTTWETLSWNKISHMKVWPRKYGSPFDKGYKENIKLYFLGHHKKGAIKWQMPTSLPSINQGEKMIEKRKYSYMFEKVFIK
mmetsp:Transcript_33708/g.33199  ORF Transcript_33708/g.33199 Transcript_33708/m.33199 type:complete len:166 (+) Transcript_33708:929-1426(+)